MTVWLICDGVRVVEFLLIKIHRALVGKSWRASA
jgi:hypothetical protein